MSSKNANEAAFPASGSWRDESPEVISVQQEGLTKREYFAAMAMQGMLACMNGWDANQGFIIHLTEHAVKYADELLNQLETNDKQD